MTEFITFEGEAPWLWYTPSGPVKHTVSLRDNIRLTDWGGEMEPYGMHYEINTEAGEFKVTKEEYYRVLGLLNIKDSIQNTP